MTCRQTRHGESLSFKNYRKFNNSNDALIALVKDRKTVSIVTGSLYLLSEIYPHILKKI